LRASISWLTLLGLCFGLALIEARARADLPFTIEARMDGARFGQHLAIFEDPSASLSFEQIQTPGYARRFVPAPNDAPGFGFKESVFWLRFAVHNPSSEMRPWLLELAYPHLDHITLYAQRADGSFSQREAGDLLPFSQRDVDYRNFVFALEAGPHAQLTYYIRIQTSSSVNLPLVAWTTLTFLSHNGHETAGFWLFYGILIIMAAYNFTLFLFLRQSEYLYYVLYNLSLLLFEFTLHGHTFQYLLPNRFWLANHILPFSIGINFLWTTLFLQTYLGLRTNYPRSHRFTQGLAWAAGLISLFGLLAPYALSIRVLVVATLIMTVASMVLAIPLAHQGMRQARLFIVAWTALVGGVLVYVFKAVGFFPSNFITEWGIQIGASMEVVLLSLALADRINIMRANLSELNAQLSNNVSELRLALEQAEAGTRAKTEFLATVSHELRTPLNTIINIPEGLLHKFTKVEAACCENCASMFELEPGETISTQSPCPECGALGALSCESTTRFVGEPATVARHLKHIERSGRHLLQMVNGILDFSKVEAGKLELSVNEVHVGELLSETVEPLCELAASSRVRLVIDPDSESGVISADALRLKQVLINLIGNAIKFSDHRGTITVGAAREGEQYVFSVRDQGIGIGSDDCERIFQSFEQVHRGDTRKYGGTGLGLSICKALVAMHDGRIWVESKLGEGSVFRFSVPIHGPKQRAASGKALPRTAPRPSFETKASLAELGRESLP
jgi:signal transduction histidine kinase